MSQLNPNFSQYRTVGEAAEFLGVTAATLRNWDRSGKLKPRRHPQNGYRIYLHEDLEAILRSADLSLQPDDSFAPLIDWSDMRDNEHFVQFYESDDYLISSVAGFLGAALAEDQCAVVIATGEHRDGFERALTELAIDPAEAVDEGRLVWLDAAETLERLSGEDGPEKRRFNDVIGGLLARLGRGGRRIHAYGEMVALLWEQGKRQGAVRLEELWRDLARTHRFALCCGYPLDAFRDRNDEAAINGICKCHSRVIPGESYSVLADPYERLQEVARLQQKAKALEAEIKYRKEIEQALSLRERELADFFENASEGLHKVAPDGRILWANRAELNLLGYEADEYVGRHIAEFYVDQELIADILERLSQGEALHNQPARLRCKDGSIRDVLISSNVCMQEGRFAYTRCFTRDITELKRAERDRAMLAAIVDSSDDAIVSKGLDGIIRSWNAGAQRIFGYAPDEVIGRPITTIIPPERIEEETEILNRLRRGERVDHFETVRLAKNGRPVDISLTISPVRDGEGRVIGASKIARDISERKHAAAALSESEARFQKLTELLPVGVYTCEAPSGRITYFNQKAAELWGRTPDLGQPHERYCGSLRILTPSGARVKHDECPMALALQNGAVFRNHEAVIEHPDGSQITALVNIEPVRDSAGNIIGAINVFHDVTALKQAETALRNEKENLQTLLETLPIAVFRAEDPSCRRISGNRTAADLLRMPIGANLSKTAPLDEQPHHFQVRVNGEELTPDQLPIQRAARGEAVFAEAVEFLFHDGTTVHALVSAKPLFDGEGRPRGAVACMLDVSELKRAELSLLEADRRKDEFLATLAHELRNPLAPIRNGMELLRISEADAALAGEIHGIMERQMEHLTRLVDDLLDVSRITHNRIELRKRRVDLAEVIQSALEASRPLIDEAGHELTISLPADPVQLEADPTRLAQVFANLLNNSAKYTEPGGRISLQAQVQGTEVVVIVEDNGVGISCEALAYVFDMFRQADGALERSRGGLGIGLTLARRLIELHGGTINAQSEGVGKGSAFIVRLPIAAETGMEQTRLDTKPSPMTQLRILLVDDNRDSVFTLSSVLRIKGNEIRTAYDGLEAIEVAGEFRPDVILMDIGMPKLNGYEATRRIRQTEWGKDMFIIALSGWGQSDDLQKSADAGCSAHLTKPLDFTVLESLLAGRTRAKG
jgi:PAS domain S-box-containing protein